MKSAFDDASSIEQILGRALIGGDTADAEAFLARHRILVTGAGGSIGSALTDLLVGLRPVELVLLEHHENSLFQLRQRLMERGYHRETPLRFVLADVRDRRKIAAVLGAHTPEIVFHLAAYKHVPLAEESPEQFVDVNVLGTWRLIEEARRAGVQRVIYPSTDKAVSPPSIYGATKRFVEQMLQAVAAEGGPDCAAVRLVNVLGANGGVIQTFARQIGEGRPLTVTDPAMTRYWITMEEALYLLTQAAHRGQSDRVLVLDIGKPVGLMEVADRLWKLFGSPEKPLEIQYLGARPGERLHEYLYGDDEVATPSEIPGLLEVQGRGPRRVGLAEVAELVAEFEALVEADAGAALRERLFAAVPRREPSVV